jgi:hypothetical protein
MKTCDIRSTQRWSRSREPLDCEPRCGSGDRRSVTGQLSVKEGQPAASLHDGKPDGENNGHCPDEDTLRVHSGLMEVAERKRGMSDQPCIRAIDVCVSEVRLQGDGTIEIGDGL